MKLKNLTTYKTKLTTLNLINAKIFSKETTSENVSIDQIKYQLKKALKIIYKFHVNDKKILFIGKVDNKVLDQLKNSKHAWYNELGGTKGFITNNQLDLQKRKTQNKYNLMVILNSNNCDKVVEESYSAKIPTIVINTQLNIFDYKCDYKIPGNFNFARRITKNTFFYSLLEATLKRANYFKNKRVKFEKQNYLSKRKPIDFRKKSMNFKRKNYDFKKKKTN